MPPRPRPETHSSPPKNKPTEDGKSEDSKPAAADALAGAEQQVTELTQKRDEAQKAFDAADKARQEAQTAAETAEKDQVASQGLLERNQENKTLAKSTLEARQQDLTTRNEQVTAAEAAHKEVTARETANRDAVAGLALSNDDPLGVGTYVVLRANGQVEMRTIQDGSVVDSHATPLRDGLGTVPHMAVGRSEAGRVALAALRPTWQLAGTIGDATDPHTLADRVLCLDFSPDSQQLASGGGEPSRAGELKVWNVADRTLVRQWPDAHSDSVFAVRFAPDGKTLATAAADRFAKTFDVETGELSRVFEGHTHYVQAVAWRADGRLLVTGGADKAVKFWDPTTGEQKKTLTDAGKEVTGIGFLGLEDRVVYASGDGQVVAVGSDGNNKQGMAGAASFLHTLSSTSDGERIVAAGEDRVVRMWSKDGKLAFEIEPEPAPEGEGS